MKKLQNLIGSILLLMVFVSSCNEKTSVSIPEAEPAGGVTQTSVIEQSPDGELTSTVEPSFESSYMINYEVYIPEIFLNVFEDVDIQNAYPLAIDSCSNSSSQVFWRGEYIFSLAVRFSTVSDSVSFSDLEQIWQGKQPIGSSFTQILILEEYKDYFQPYWGNSDEYTVRYMSAERILSELWDDPEKVAVLPFDEVTPEMKVLAVDGQNPMLYSFSSGEYPLSFDYCLVSEYDIDDELAEVLETIPTTNRDPGKMTSLLMTGVTALTRETAYKMELNGVMYPAEEILDWFENSDVVHISNEVPFTEECPIPEPPLSSSRFCSRKDYFDLLTGIGVDVLELTGNHLLDYGEDAFQETMDLIDQEGIRYFGGGRNLEAAQSPLLIDNNGNQIAFLGCNVPGPESDFATTDSGGANPCDIEEMVAQIQSLTAKGYQVVAGIQHYEACQHEPMSIQVEDMTRLAEAGAVIVSGSQAHCSQGMSFVGGNFIHYGLGNLFFDQMWDFYRNAFLDYHVFYDGKYLGVQLITTRLEDASQPRSMTSEEREVFLEEIFQSCGWETE